MTVQKACEALAQHFRKNIKYFRQGGSLVIADVFPDSQEASFVEELLSDLRTEVLRSDVSMDVLIGRQEGLAFLGQLQRTDKSRKSGRLATLVRGINNKASLATEDNGALTLQLQGIGSKVDSEFVSDVNGV
jgi:hypothetical protein